MNFWQLWNQNFVAAWQQAEAEVEALKVQHQATAVEVKPGRIEPRQAENTKAQPVSEWIDYS